MSDQGSGVQPLTPPRAEKRRRPSKSLPTDRIKFETQVRVLQTMGRLSGAGRAVDNQRLSKALNGEVSHYTVGLSHAFFVDAGWLEKRGRGDYAASQALLDFTRRVSTGSELVKAVESLRTTAREAWFWRAVEPHLTHAAAPAHEVLVTLMQEAQVGEAHLPQLRILLEWLRFVGLIESTDDGIAAAGPARTPSTGTYLPADSRGEVAPVRDAATPIPGAPTVATAPTHHALTEVPAAAPAPSKRADSVLSLDVSLQVTAADLAKLNPEQIQALFQAVGAVLAIKNDHAH